MSHDDKRASGDLPFVPGEPGSDEKLPPLAARPTTGAPDALGFHLRFEGGHALLALENSTLVPGVSIHRALFEVPDVAFPLDVTGGAHRFQDKLLTLRAIEIDVDAAHVLDPATLARAGIRLARSRTRQGALEILFELQGPGGPVGVRARIHIVPAGNAGVAFVVDGLTGFGPLPQTRLALSEALLAALQLPGGYAPRAMVRRAEVFRAILGRLLPSYGWKVPALGDVRVHEAMLQKSTLTMRGWAGDLPDGWKRPRQPKRAHIDDAVALAVFADTFADAATDEARLAVVDRLIDKGAVSPAVAPFLAEVLRRDPRRRADAETLLADALARAPDDLALLSAAIDDPALDDSARIVRLARLGEAAEEQAEPWVSAQAFHAASVRALAVGMHDDALRLAESAFAADPTLGATARLLARLLSSAGRDEEALKIGRQALERLDDEDDIEAFSAELAPIAARVEGVEPARQLLSRALRHRDRHDALSALIDVESSVGALDRASELLARLLVLDETRADRKKARHVHMLAARIAARRDDVATARAHLTDADALAPGDVEVALARAELEESVGDLDSAYDVLSPWVEAEAPPLDIVNAAVRILAARQRSGDARLARGLLTRTDDAPRTAMRNRVEAEVLALEGDPLPLALLLDAEGRAEPSGARATVLLEAAARFLDAGKTDRAVSSIAAALDDGAAIAPVVALAVRHDAAQFARAIASSDESLVSRPQRRQLARAFADAAAPAAAALVLDGLRDLDDLRATVSFAAASDDVALALAALQGLRLALPPAASSGEALEVVVRLATLAATAKHSGVEPTMAADLFAEAHGAGAEVVAPWLDAALRTQDPTRLAQVLVATDVPCTIVPSDALRRVRDTAAIDFSARPERLLEVARTAADRRESIDDAERYLAILDDRSELRTRAAERIRVGREHVRPSWVAEGVAILVDDGAATLALDLTAVAEGEIADDAGVLQARFAAAVIAGAAQDVDDTATRLLETLPREALQARVAVHGQRVRALGITVDGDDGLVQHVHFADADVRARAGMALGAWLDEEAAAPVLSHAVALALEDGDLVSAESRVMAAIAAGLDAQRHARLASDVARAWQERDDAQHEVDVLETLLAHDDEVVAIGAANRVATLLEKLGRPDDACDVYRRRAELGGAVDEVADAWRAVARLTTGDRASAAAAWAQVLELQPTDDEAITARLALLEQLEDWAPFASLLSIRAARMHEGPERTANLVRLGVILDEKLGDVRHAARAWLLAARSRPFSEVPLKKLLALAERENDHKIRVRAHIASAQAIFDGDVRARHAIEAGALLAGILMRPRLAVPLFERAAIDADDKRPALRALVEIYRAVDDGARALSAAERFTETYPDDERALGLEIQADIHDRNLGDRIRAADLRREALARDPALRVSGLALAAFLRSEGRLRDVIDVRQKLADASEQPAQRAQTYAHLADLAETELDDQALMVELAVGALAIDPHLRSLRARVVEAHIALGQLRAACDELAVLLTALDLTADERTALARRKATLELVELSDPTAARTTLAGALAIAEDSDVLLAVLVDVLSQLEQPIEAAELLEGVLRRHEDGLPALGSRREILERAAMLREDGSDLTGAMDLLDEAAALGKLARASELRRARLAEQLDRPGDAVASLLVLFADRTSDVDETVALAGRLGTAAERAGRFDVAIKAWAERVERVRGDIEAERTLERLALLHGAPDAARRAADALLFAEVGDDDERRARLVFVAEDALTRTDEPLKTLHAVTAARALRDGEDLLSLGIRAARIIGDTASELALLDDLRDIRGALDDEERLRHAELALSIAPERALTSLIGIAEESPELDARTHALLAAAVRAAPNAAANTIGAKIDDGGREAIVALLRTLLTDVDALDEPHLSALSERLPTDVELGRAAASRALSRGQRGESVDRLLDLANALRDVDEAAALAIREDAAREAVAAGASVLVSRVDALADVIARDPEMRGDGLHILRDSEAWPGTARLLEAMLDVLEGPEVRSVRFELALVLRAELEDPRRAAAVLESLLDDDEADREVWGELLECLDEASDDVELARMLGRRLLSASGFELRELCKRRAHILLKLGRAHEAAADLALVRRDARDDEALRSLHITVATAVGPQALADVLVDELLATGSPRDALAVLACAPGLVEDLALSRAALRAVEEDPGTISTIAGRVLDESADVSAAVVLSVAARRTGQARVAWLESVRSALIRKADAAVELERRASLARALTFIVDSEDIEVYLPLVALDVTWLARRAGPRVALQRLRGLSSRFADRHQIDPLLLSLLARAGFVREATESAAVVLLRAPATADPTLEARARDAVGAAARTGRALVAAVRVSHDEGVRSAWRALSPDDRALAHRGVRALRSTTERLALRHALLPDVAADGRAVEARQLAATALACGDRVREAALLDVCADAGVLDVSALERRATLALELDAADAAVHIARAAELGDPLHRVFHRRSLVHLYLRRGSDLDDVARALEALVQAAPDDAALVEETLELARAARLDDMVDELLGEAVKRAKDDESRSTLQARRVEHRLKVGRDARGAFLLLLDDEGGREAAYRLAAREALVEEQTLVVDDDLAEAALLWFVGRRAEATAKAQSCVGPAADVLRAEMARASHDIAEERSALLRLREGGTADTACIVRLAELSAALDAAASVAALVDVLGREAARTTEERARVLLAELLASADVPVGPIIGDLFPILDRAPVTQEAWPLRRVLAEVALRQSVDAAALLVPLVERSGDDAIDALYLDHLLAKRAPAEVGDALLALGTRPAVLSLGASRPHELHRALTTLLHGHAGFVITLLRALGSDVPLAVPLAWLLVDALEQEHRLEEATQVLAGIVDDGETSALLRRMRSATLELRRGSIEDAARTLDEIAQGTLDDTARAQAVTLASRVGPRALPALLRLVDSHSVGEAEFARVLDLVEEGGSKRLSVAAATWVLDRQKRHHRALDIVRKCSEGEAGRFFSGQAALQGGTAGTHVRHFDDSATDSLAPTIARALKIRARRPIADAAARAGARAGAARDSMLARARQNPIDERRHAWAALARQAAEADESLLAARYLTRAHISLDDAPIEIRLAADPALAEPVARADAIALALSDLDRPSTSRADLLVALTKLDDAGFAGGRHRALLADADDEGPIADLVSQERRDVLRARVTTLGRHPRAGERSALAVALAALGDVELARALHPGVVAQTRSDAAVDEIAQQPEQPPDGANEDAARVSLSRAMLKMASRGTSLELEREVRSLAQAASRSELVDASFARAMAIETDPQRRAQLVLERAVHAWRTLKKPAIALAAARSLADLDDTVLPRAARIEASSLWAGAALAKGDMRAAQAALAHQETLVETSASRLAIRARRSGLALASGDASLALSLVDDALALEARLDDGMAAPKEARARALLALGRARDAGGALLDAALDRAIPTSEAKRLAREAAQVAHDAGDVRLAVRALLAIVDVDDTALSDADVLARASGDPSALGVVIDARIAHTTEAPDRRALVLERAHLLYGPLDDKGAAIEALEAQAVADDGDHVARIALAGWYLTDKRLLDAALAFESASAIALAPADARAHAAHEAASLLASLGDLERATPLAKLAVSLGVTDRAVLQVLAAAHREQGRFELLDDTLELEQSITDDPRARASIWLERAAIRREVLHDDGAARKAVHSALELAPDHPVALDMMRDDALASGNFGALRAALSRAAELTDDDQLRVRWLVEIATLDEERFHDLRASEATIDRALEVVGQDATLLLRKAVLLAKSGRLDGLPAILDAAERAGARDLPGALWIVRGDALLIAGDRAAATRAFEAATRDADSRDRAWDRLIDLADAANDDATVALRLGFARLATADAERRAALSRREARIRQRLGDEDRAMSAFESVLEDDPSDTEALRALQEIYARRRRAEKLDPMMERWALAGGEPAEVARRLAEYGSYLVDQLGAEARGRAAFEAALTHDEREPMALTRLALISSAASQHRRALELLDRIDVNDWTEGPRDILFRRAVAARALEADDALQRFQAVLVVDPRHVPSLEAQVELSEHSGDRAALRGSLVALADAIDERADPVRLAKALTELARVHVDEGSPEDALRAAERAFDLRPNALPTLQVFAEARALAGQYADAAELLRRIEAIVPPVERALVMDRRATMLVQAGDLARAIETLVELQGLSDDATLAGRIDALRAQVRGERSPDETARLPVSRGAPTSPDADVGPGFEQVPVTAASDLTLEGSSPPREEMTSPGFNALSRQVEGMIDEGKHDEAMALLREAFTTGSADAEQAQLGIRAARASRNARELAFFVEQRLRGASDQQEVKALALEAGRALRDVLNEHERAADLLYLAHQAAPDDVDVRLELTELYARIPRLLGHAQTGVLQLLRRAPGNARACRIAAVVAERQHIPEKREAMLAIAEILSARARPLDVQERPTLPPVSARRSLDEQTLKSRLAPDGFASDLDLVLSAIEGALETIFASDAAALVDARRLSDVSPAALPLFERIDRVLPGRAVKLLVGPNPNTVVHAGSTLHIVLPETALKHGDTFANAALARAVFVARTGGVIASLDDKSAMASVLELARAVLLGAPLSERQQPRAETLRKALSPARVVDLRRRAATALVDVDLDRFVDMHRRAADRFALLMSGSLVASLAVGPVPDLAQAGPDDAVELLRASPRALDLISFAARDNAWLLRRDLGLVSA
jgi:tetratricopeptide (TPR) repeat protein